MPRPSIADHKIRKNNSRLVCVDEKGKPINQESTSRAVQDKRDSCDINRIVAKTKKSEGVLDAAQLTGLAKNPGKFGDFTNVVDFQEMNNRVIRMNDAFMTLTPETRMKFNNNPAELVQFMDAAKTNPALREESIKLGLHPKPVFSNKKLETPEGNFWVTYKDDVEIKRSPIVASVPAPER